MCGTNTSASANLSASLSDSASASTSADGKVLRTVRQLDDAPEALIGSPSMSTLNQPGFGPQSIRDEDGGFLYPTNTIVASNGEVYHVEPFQLPPPNDIAALISELKSRREHGDSTMGIEASDGGTRERSYSNISVRGEGESYGPLKTPFGSAQMVRRRNNSGKGSGIPTPGDWMNFKAVDTAAANATAAKRIHDGGDDGDGDSSSMHSSASSSPMQKKTYKDDADFFNLEEFSIGSYLSTELLGMGEPSNVEQKAVDSIQNFLAVPFKLECFLSFGWLICLDNFLYVLTFLPIRWVMCLPLLAQYVMNHVRILKSNASRIAPKGKELHRTHVYDLMRGAFVIIGFTCLKFLDMSRVYHYVRQQSTIKLYVLTGMLEIFDKLLCSFGQDAFDLLYWQTRNQPSWRNLVFSFSLVAMYIVVHSMMYFLLVATLTVAINSADQAMIAVLVLNNFAEIKGFVFKKFDKQNLFQLACADVTERFNLTLFMGTIFLVGVVQAGDAWLEVVKSFAYTILWMVLCEAGADWIKHAFITKFNHIDSSVYEDYFRLLRKDVLNCRRDKGMLDRTYAITRRVGLSQIPLNCVFLRYLWLIIKAPVVYEYCAEKGTSFVVLAVMGFVGSLVALKVTTGVGLVYIAAGYSNQELQVYYQRRKPNSRNKELLAGLGKLMNIERYTIHKGRVVG
jgi:hypothetical protein